MSTPDYVPTRGDLVWISFDPQAGHEQAGRRPAIALATQEYARRSGLGLFCPITNQRKGYAFELALPENLPVTGVVLTDQVKSLDWRARKVEYAGLAGDAFTDRVLHRAGGLLH
ncbi:MAG: type II toxin-antitoxin system PemK/MazF family toxin [Dehalococcoidia bacterium]